MVRIHHIGQSHLKHLNHLKQNKHGLFENDTRLVDRVSFWPQTTQALQLPYPLATVHVLQHALRPRRTPARQLRRRRHDPIAQTPRRAHTHTSMKIFCTHCGSQDHSITSCPKLKISHGTPRPNIETNQLYLYRLNLVRKYLTNPTPWPDGLDWPNWPQPHELWYTSHESEWAQAVKDNPDPDAAPEPPPRRRPMSSLLSSAAITAAPPQRIQSVTAPTTVPKNVPLNPVPENQPVPENVPKIISGDNVPEKATPISGTAKQQGRPPRPGQKPSETERKRAYRARKRTQIKPKT
jgi:hypothetical protein